MQPPWSSTAGESACEGFGRWYWSSDRWRARWKLNGKIKCSWKWKINVFQSENQMCAFPNRKLNMQFWDFPKIAAFWKNPENFWSNLAKIQQNSGNICNICKKSAKKSAILTKKLRWENGVHCVYLGESFPTNSSEYLVPFTCKNWLRYSRDWRRLGIHFLFSVLLQVTRLALAPSI